MESGMDAEGDSGALSKSGVLEYACSGLVGVLRCREYSMYRSSE